MKILIAADSFKDALPAHQVCAAIGKGLRQALPGVSVVEFPLADGGEGTAEVLAFHLGGERRQRMVTGPLGEKVLASYSILKNGTLAVVETAAASGLELLNPAIRNPLKTSSYGTGEVLAEALRHGVKKIALALGGSATNDGGMGMAAALGWQFLDKNGDALSPVGASLERVAALHFKGESLHHKLPTFPCPIEVICDVNNPLFGEKGAAHVFAPQKGASPEAVQQLDKGLRHFAQIVENQLNMTGLALQPGAGAAGGLGFGAMAFLGATLHRGIELVLDWTNFVAALAHADLLITGEGKLDGQTLHGKLIHGICSQAKVAGIPVIALSGTLQLPPEGIETLGLAAAFSILQRPVELKTALQETERGLEEAAFSLGKVLGLKP